jgi:hypothetical protein
MPEIRNLSWASDARLHCAESGHWWPPAPFTLRQWNRQKVGERVQKCARDGCERERVTRISVRTGEQIGRTLYRGRLASIGQVYRSQLRRELAQRQ